ncbi:MAG: hypothetical protein EKK37_01045 [Sphingobacteriales bacterium]|nr:MAG: hypothetical protein EKK37_01045 [Sphingobacteriales bacterium]
MIITKKNVVAKHQNCTGRRFTSFSLMLAGLIILIQLSSCTPASKLVYFNNLNASVAKEIQEARDSFTNVIQKNDQLWITVGGTNAEDLVAINSASGVIQGTNLGSGGAGNLSPALGYLVESDGTIKLPYLGKVRVEGLTRLELEDHLTEKFKDYTKNPIVNVRFMNYKVTVLGAVAKPGSFTFPNERMTVLDALGLAGDLTNTSKRDEVLVIREANGVRSFGKINLLSADVFKSPYYFLNTNDVIYVTPLRAIAVNREKTPQYVGMVAGILSLLTSIFYIIKK